MPATQQRSDISRSQNAVIAGETHEDQLRNNMAYRAGALEATIRQDLDLLERVGRILRRNGQQTSLVVDLTQQTRRLQKLLAMVEAAP